MCWKTRIVLFLTCTFFRHPHLGFHIIFDVVLFTPFFIKEFVGKVFIFYFLSMTWLGRPVWHNNYRSFRDSFLTVKPILGTYQTDCSIILMQHFPGFVFFLRLKFMFRKTSFVIQAFTLIRRLERWVNVCQTIGKKIIQIFLPLMIPPLIFLLSKLDFLFQKNISQMLTLFVCFLIVLNLV